MEEEIQKLTENINTLDQNREEFKKNLEALQEAIKKSVEILLS